MPLGREVGLGPDDIVLDGDPTPPPKKRGTAPSFWPISIVAKWSPISATAEHLLVMAALRSRCGHFIFILWFLLLSFFFFSSPNLSRRRLDVYHTSTHGVAFVRI